MKTDRSQCLGDFLCKNHTEEKGSFDKDCPRVRGVSLGCQMKLGHLSKVCVARSG